MAPQVSYLPLIVVATLLALSVAVVVVAVVRKRKKPDDRGFDVLQSERRR